MFAAQPLHANRRAGSGEKAEGGAKDEAYGDDADADRTSESLRRARVLALVAAAHIVIITMHGAADRQNFEATP